MASLGAGAPYRLSAGADKRISRCVDREGQPVVFDRCLDAAGFTAVFSFAAIRAIAR